ncbi:MAG: glycosyltransferase [Gammaproteobacteria bacterium]|nr:glycosyltransferase [Gammaproteobacteria bacterium]MDH5226236.1 glycosyltransferase [Gammaproteobacteria bacterium]
MKKLSGFLIVVLFAMLTVAAWGYANRPTAEPELPRVINGFAFQPYQKDQNALTGDDPTVEEIEGDLKLLAGTTRAVRTYSALGTLGETPALARKHGLKVMLGSWLNSNVERNEREIEATIRLANANRNVHRILVGNEVVLRGDLTVEDLTAHLDRVRAATRQPVSTAEPWHVWIAHPELAEHVDFIAVHMLPYWEGVEVESAVGYVIDKLALVQRTFPGKPIVIGEVGWPSEGRTRESAVATTANEALFLRRFLAYAERQRLEYFVMEAFDQPWKAAAEGKVGAYWGVYDADRQQKFEFRAPIVRVPHWHVLAAASVLAAAFMLWLFYFHSHSLRNRGRSFLAVVVYATATLLVWTLYDLSQQYLTVSSVLVGAVLLVGMLGVVAVLFAEAHEWAEARWVDTHRRLLRPLRVPESVLPRVSIHVPAYNEPPEMLIETLDALANLDYPDYEVLVIDNNTQDEAVWRPVEAHCAQLGARFRFFHVSPLAGFKAGALNFALRHTAPDADVVAVIDADYIVRPEWLRDLAPAFANPRTGVVQAPQDYRDAGESAFKAMCHAEYRGFFHIGMITRNERNAIIQHGTMTMVRRSLLERIGWSEWCITEDAELGLRILDEGYEATYIPTSYGRGVMPDTFLDFKKQRSRWAFGAMQILRRHFGALIHGRNTGLTAGQRYHFVAGWLPWLADGFNLVVNIAALVWSLVMVLFPHNVEPPLLLFSVLPLSLFLFKLVKLLHLYRARVGATFTQTIAAAIAGLGLSHTVGSAMLSGFINKDRPFFRTPKRTTRHAWLQSLAAAREEAVLMCGLWVAAFAVSRIPDMDGDMSVLVGSPDLTVWVTVLLVQSIPYAAAVIVSLVSSLQLPGHWIGEARDTWISEPVVLDEADAVASQPVHAALSAAARSGDNGGALPATAKLDSAK